MTNIYKETDCGANGKTFERELKRFLGLKIKIARQGRTDMRKGNVCYELKTNSGELGVAGEKLLKGCSHVIYVPVVNPELPVERQEGFVIEREAFLSILDGLGLIREKTSTSGVQMVTIQTIWNNKKNAPHSKKKYNALIDALYEECDSTLDEWLAQW